MGMANHVVQRWPGDGMVPPGDCGWATYLPLRGSVETAKAVVSTLGACSAGDNCLTSGDQDRRHHRGDRRTRSAGYDVLQGWRHRSSPASARQDQHDEPLLPVLLGL